MYGFEGEVKTKLNETFVELFSEVFCCLPLAYVLNKKVFVVHGGLFSDDGVKLSDIRAINRFREPPEEGKLILLYLFMCSFRLCLKLSHFEMELMIIFFKHKISACSSMVSSSHHCLIALHFLCWGLCTTFAIF